VAQTTWALPNTVLYDEDGRPSMIGGRCASCGNILFPKPKVCPSCWAETIEDEPLPRTGQLYAYTVVHVARKGWTTPYVISYVDLENGVRVSAPLDCDPSRVPAMGSKLVLSVKEIYRQPDGTPVMTHCFKSED
jgi:uncharacterized protein